MKKAVAESKVRAHIPNPETFVFEIQNTALVHNINIQ
jgi:hypothetical protein